MVGSTPTLNDSTSKRRAYARADEQTKRPCTSLRTANERQPSNTKWTSSLARSWTDHTSSRSITASTSASPLSTHSCTPYTHSTEHHNTFTHPHKTNHIYSH